MKSPLDRNLVSSFIGGRGLASKILYSQLEPNTDPYAPENLLIINVGPLAGTLAPFSSRLSITAKSPLTSTLGGGNAGGDFGPELRLAGYDAVIFKGIAKKPVYLCINDDEVELLDADSVWGFDVYETCSVLRKEMGDPLVRVAAIGPAGENLVKIANIIFDAGRGGGRGGIGAVMASKNLKAVAVRGTKQIEIAHFRKLEKTVEKVYHRLSKSEDAQNIAKMGTPRALTNRNELGILATRNFGTGVFPYAEKISWKSLHEEYLIHNKRKACFGCPISSSAVYIVDEGPFKGTYGEGPQFAQTGGFGSMCWNSDLACVLKLSEISNRYGMDVISLAGTLAFAMECYEKRIITKKDTGGIELEWGGCEAMIQMVHEIANRHGFGNVLAEGSKRAAEIIGKGAPRFTLECKGLEIPVNDPRGLQGWGLAYATSTRGGDHCRGAPGVEFGGWPSELVIRTFNTPKAADPLTTETKGQVVKWCEELRAVEDSLELCKFIGDTPGMWDLYPELFGAVTGILISQRELFKIGERIYNLEKAFNVREGFSRKDDTLSHRLMNEPMPQGPKRGKVVQLKPMLDEYYKARGWNVKNGIPTRRKLEELGLTDVARDLEKLGSYSR